MKISFLSAAFALLPILPFSAFATSGPQHLSFRPLSMGNAFVAVVDDKDALYYNPAGLNLINSLGNPKRRPEMANYPRDRFDLCTEFGAILPLEDMLDFLRIYRKHKDSFSDFDSTRADTSLVKDLTPFDRKPIRVGVPIGTEFAMHNFGVALWAAAQVAPYPDLGILLPQAGVQTIQMDAVFQIAGAYGFMKNRLSVGAGYRLASRQEVQNYQIAASDFDNTHKLVQSIMDTLNTKLDNYEDLGNYGHGVDLGVLWQQTPWLRFGAAEQNLGMFLNGKPVTPAFTVGAAVTPVKLQKGGVWARKMNFALDFEDLLNNDNNYKFLSKVNFGAEIEQHVWWLMSLRLGGGFKGGYWTAGMGLNLLKTINLEAVSWADEGGYYTGEIENRYYAVNVGLGI